MELSPDLGNQPPSQLTPRQESSAYLRLLCIWSNNDLTILFSYQEYILELAA